MAEMLSRIEAGAREPVHNTPFRNPNRARLDAVPVTYKIAPNNVGKMDSKFAKRLGASQDSWLRKFTAGRGDQKSRSKKANNII
jgi:hypothetical protein